MEEFSGTIELTCSQLCLKYPQNEVKTKIQKGIQASSGKKNFLQVQLKCSKKDKEPLRAYNRISIGIPGHVGKMIFGITKPPPKTITRERYPDNDVDPHVGMNYVRRRAGNTACSVRLINLQGGHARMDPIGKKRTDLRPLQGIRVDRSNGETSGKRMVSSRC